MTKERTLWRVQAALVDLVEFRLLLEGEAASLAAQRATPEDLALIREKLAIYQDAVRRSEDVYAHDVEFHRAVSSLTRSLIRSGVGGMACPSTSRSLVATSQSSDNLRLRNGGNRSLTGLS